MRIVLRNGFAHPQKAGVVQDVEMAIEQAAQRQLALERIRDIHYTQGQLYLQFENRAAMERAARMTCWAAASGKRVLAVQMLPGDGRAWLVAAGFMYSDYQITQDEVAANDA